VKILVVDDHPLILEALQHLLRQLDSEVELYAACSAEAGRLLVAAHQDAALLLLDLNLPGVRGLELLTELREAYPTVPVVVISGSDHHEDIVKAIDLGAMGFIPKHSDNSVMLQALKLVLSGGVYLPVETLARRRSNDAPKPVAHVQADDAISARELGLTERQVQVLGHILQGKPNKLICRELGLAEGTVKIHVAAILRALKVGNRTQAVIEASRLGLRIDYCTSASAPLRAP
jgi:DNA-binding NarL/FixJ family response regulator